MVSISVLLLLDVTHQTQMSKPSATLELIVTERCTSSEPNQAENKFFFVDEIPFLDSSENEIKIVSQNRTYNSLLDFRINQFLHRLTKLCKVGIL